MPRNDMTNENPSPAPAEPSMKTILQRLAESPEERRELATLLKDIAGKAGRAVTGTFGRPQKSHGIIPVINLQANFRCFDTER